MVLPRLCAKDGKEKETEAVRVLDSVIASMCGIVLLGLSRTRDTP